jgi:hypothetical protein
MTGFTLWTKARNCSGHKASAWFAPLISLCFPKGVQRAYQSVIGPVFWTVNDSLEWLWPVNRLSSNLMLIADKPRLRLPKHT